jgi:hypothetical protein
LINNVRIYDTIIRPLFLKWKARREEGREGDVREWWGDCSILTPRKPLIMKPPRITVVSAIPLPAAFFEYNTTSHDAITANITYYTSIISIHSFSSD